jgi:hypothetical protein
MDVDSMRRASRMLVAIVFAGLSLPVAGARAQGVESHCSYQSCALWIVPRWNGLAVTRGASGPDVANLGFFLPRSVTEALRGGAGVPAADSAAACAQRALRLRRAGAAFTDIGAIAALAAVASAASRGFATSTEKVALGVGATFLVVSVPLQFAADGALSRAVWWHNSRYASPHSDAPTRAP